MRETRDLMLDKLRQTGDAPQKSRLQLPQQGREPASVQLAGPACRNLAFLSSSKRKIPLRSEGGKSY